MEEEQGEGESRVVQVELIVQLADVGVPRVSETPETNQELRDLRQHVASFRQNLIEAGHGRVDNNPDGSGDAVIFVHRPPRVEVAKGCTGDEILG